MIGLLGKLQDLTGMRFGRLKVIERGDDYISPGGHREVRWWCKCECKEDNDLKLVTGSNLKAGHVRSCGCFAIETFIRKGGKFKNETRRIIYRSKSFRWK